MNKPWALNIIFNIFIHLDARKGDDSRIKHLKESVIEKRGHVYRAHNEYTVKIREYNFVDKQYVHKVRNLLIYHEEIQLILNKSWLVLSLFF
jgi:hypothetical protein